jgi:hypothetical protein
MGFPFVLRNQEIAKRSDQRRSPRDVLINATLATLMNAQAAGYGYALPMPRFPASHLGKLMFLDDQGVVRTVGKLSDDANFKRLCEEAEEAIDFKSTGISHPSTTVALVSGCIEVKPLTSEECSTYLLA